VFIAPFSPERHALRALLHRDDNGRVHVALHQAEHKPRIQADATTGGTSDGRMALHRTLANLASEYADRVIGLIFVSVDAVANLQADHGLAGSDSLLQEAGLFLLEGLRGTDRCFRFAAGEYAVVIERNTREQLKNTAAHIHDAFGQELFGDGKQSLHLTATVAHTLLGVEAPDNDRRFMRTVQAAHTTQQAGGNELVEVDQIAPATPISTAGDDEWTTRLRQALAQDRFSLAYQNITSLAGDNQVYFDVLLRYIDDTGALLRPADFLPAAESAGLMPDIDRWVVTHAIDVVEQQMARDIHVSLFVKLSRETIQDARGFLDWARRSLGAMQAPRSSLVFSLRASDVSQHVAESKHLAVALQAQGFRTALTHFGHTSTSVQLLEKMALSFIKLSPEFAREVAGETADDTQLQRVIDSARDRNIPLIAEQIEDASSMARLWQAGVNYVQGHFIQEPDTQAIAHTDLRQ